MTIAQIPASFPLAARIFHAAMQRQISLDGYATRLAVPGDTLRAVLTAQADGVPAEVVSELAAAHGQPADASLAAPTLVANAEPFSAWLERQMEGVPQASLRTRTQLEPRVLRAFLNGKALPDADQAERLARALYVNSAEMARIIVADMIRRSEPPQAVAAQSGVATGSGAPSGKVLATQGSPGPDAPAKVRRRKLPREAAEAPVATAPSQETASASLPAPLPPAPSGTGQVAAEPPPEEATPAAPASDRRRRNTRPAVAPAAEVTPMPQILPAEEHPSAAADVPPPPADAPPSIETGPLPVAPRRRGRPAKGTSPSPAIAQEPTPPTAPSAESDAGEHADSASTGAVTQPAAEPRKKATERAASPSTLAAIASAATALELSPDEVHLLRSYRRLHPHGRRATLQYIGSLLIEE